DRVGRHCEDDRNDRRCLTCCEQRAPRCDDDIDLEPDELGGDLGKAFAASLCPAILDRDGAALDPAEFAQSLDESGGVLTLRRRCHRAQKTNRRQFARLLRSRPERPHGCRAAEKRDELATLHSITSSARASTGGGISRPSTFAVLRLMTSSNLVGACTGRSPGFSTLRMRST